MLTIGIDPGLDGAAVALVDGVPIVWTITPTGKVRHGKGARKVFDPAGMEWWFRRLCAEVYEAGAGEYEAPDFVALEATEARPPKGRNACHSLGYSQGLWEGLLVAHRWPYEIVRAAEWLPKMTRGVPGKGTKDRTVLAARRLLPALDLTRSARSSKPHDGLADAGLLGLWAYRQGKPAGSNA